MIRNTRDKIAAEIAREKGIELIEAQNFIDLFLQLTYKEGFVVIEAEKYMREDKQPKK